MQLRSIAFLGALALAGGCKSDDGGASKGPQQPTASAAPAPAPGGDQVEPGGDGAGGRQRMTPEERRAERLKEFDKNGDGRLDRDERTAMRQANVLRRMERMDKDGDGKISRDEASRPLGQRLLADFDHQDANHDSFISREELEQAILDRQARRRAERQQTGGAAPPGAPAQPGQGMDDDPLDDEE